MLAPAWYINECLAYMSEELCESVRVGFADDSS